MRTTLTLDDDVAVLLEEVRKTKGLSYKQIVNSALRVGLREFTTLDSERQRFRTQPADLGRCLMEIWTTSPKPYQSGKEKLSGDSAWRSLF